MRKSQIISIFGALALAALVRLFPDWLPVLLLASVLLGWNSHIISNALTRRK